MLGPMIRLARASSSLRASPPPSCLLGPPRNLVARVCGLTPMSHCPQAYPQAIYTLCVNVVSASMRCFSACIRCRTMAISPASQITHSSKRVTHLPRTQKHSHVPHISCHHLCLLVHVHTLYMSRPLVAASWAAVTWARSVSFSRPSRCVSSECTASLHSHACSALTRLI